MLGRSITLFALFLATAAAAADQKILVPIFYNGPGAGTQWRSFIVVVNKMSRPFSPVGVGFLIPCPIPEGCLSGVVPAGEPGWVLGPNAPGGFLLTVPADEADQLILRLEIAAVRPNQSVVGTEVPIVRERNFRTGTITLPSVMTHGGSLRTRLRVYDPDANEVALARVSLRFWNAPTSDPVESHIVTLLRAPVAGAQPTPAYTEFDIATAFPIATLLGFTFNIDIEPLSPGQRLWAFATITYSPNNEVTVVTPQ